MFPTTRIKLYAEEKAILVDGGKLNDKHINFAQALLKAHDCKIEGLRNTLQQAQFNFNTSSSDVRAFYELTLNADLTLPTNRALHEQQNDI